MDPNSSKVTWVPSKSVIHTETNNPVLVHDFLALGPGSTEDELEALVPMLKSPALELGSMKAKHNTLITRVLDT